MNAGQLDERIEFWNFKVTKNKLGEDQPEEAVLKKAWAKVEPRTGSMLSKTTHTVKVRREVLSGITPGCWILWTDLMGTKHRLDIDYILPPVRTSQFTTIYAQEVT